jgi:2-keto-4-pentenoate hydratase
MLVDRRRYDAALTDDFPPALKPSTTASVVDIQVATIAMIGPHGGWKVGAPDPWSATIASPLPAAGIVSSPGRVWSRLRGIEAEVGFRFGRSLPPRDRPYAPGEVAAAIDACHATIEVLDPRFSHRERLDPLSAAADLGMHAGLVVGAAAQSWSFDAFPRLSVTLEVDGEIVHRATASNPGGVDLLRLLTGLANSDIARALGGVRAGDIATTGSWTGLAIVPVSSPAIARFDGFPAVEVSVCDGPKRG